MYWLQWRARQRMHLQHAGGLRSEHEEAKGADNCSIDKRDPDDRCSLSVGVVEGALIADF